VLEDKENYIKATHNGYKKKFGILHTRSWKFKENKIIIEDSLNQVREAVFRLHFHPHITENEIRKKIQDIDFNIKKYNYAEEFNKTKEALVIEIPFTKKLKVEINI